MPTCAKCDKAEGVCTPVVIVPIKRWPVPLYLQYRGTLCNRCAYSFTLKDYTDYEGSWYELAADHLRSRRVPARNPYPDKPDFQWEEWLIDPKFDPEPKEQCRLEFWELATLEATKAVVPAIGGQVRLSK